MKNVIRFTKSAWYSFVGILAKRLIDEAYKDGWHEGFNDGWHDRFDDEYREGVGVPDSVPEDR